MHWNRLGDGCLHATISLDTDERWIACFTLSEGSYSWSLVDELEGDVLNSGRAENLPYARYEAYLAYDRLQYVL